VSIVQARTQEVCAHFVGGTAFVGYIQIFFKRADGLQWQYYKDSPICWVSGTCCVNISDVDAGQAKEVRPHLQVHFGRDESSFTAEPFKW